MKPDLSHVRRALEGLPVEVTGESFGVVARTEAASAAAALDALLADGYAFMVDLFATDTGEDLELTYHLRSFAADTEVIVRVSVAYDGEVPSVWESHPAALYPERETAELFGLTFAGHPNPKRLLTSDRVDGFLSRRATPVRTHEEVMRDV